VLRRHRRRGTQILIVQAHNVGDNLRIGTQGGTAVVHGALHQVLVVGFCVAEVGSRLGGRVTGGRPAGLGDRDVYAYVQLGHRRNHSVNLVVPGAKP